MSDPAVTPLLTPQGPAQADPARITWLYIILAGGLAAGLILQDNRLDHCPNDASRWSTVYFLTEHGTYEYLPDHDPPWLKPRGRTFAELTPEQQAEALLPDAQKQRWFKIGERYYEMPAAMPLFWTIDMVAKPDADGRYHYYSSKPPLLPTCLAGVVRAVELLSFGQVSFREQPWFIIRVTLIVTQLVPVLVLIGLLGRRITERISDPWTRHACLGTVAFGTYLLPWTVTLNNHVIGAACGLIAAEAALRIRYDGRRSAGWFVLAGFFGAFAAAMELPAAALLAAVLLAVTAADPRRAVLWAWPTAGLVGGAAALTNYLAIGRFKPAYADFGKPGGLYDYPGTYWNQSTGIDALAEPKGLYLFNLLLGHHGLFLLTPMLILALVGIVLHLRRRDQAGAQPLAALAVLAITAVVIGFYTFKSNNYGGTTQGPRWLLWLVPLLLLWLPEGVAVLVHRAWGRRLVYLFMLVSVLSMGFALRGPWGESWAHRLYRACGWINY